MTEELVILVDEQDNEIGTKEKLQAHKDADLHRAISVLIFNSKGEWLLQRRALTKYHSAGLWTNTCCSHPRPGEETSGAAKRRLMEEMGMEAQTLKHSFSFVYKISLEHGLSEHELDHVFVATTDNKPVINKDEVEEWKYLTTSEIENDLKSNPDNYTYWFKLIFEKVKR